MAELLAIAWRVAKRSDMQLLKQAEVTLEAGVHQDFRGRHGKRQVTLLSQRDWQAACAEISCVLPWTIRRSNLLVDHLDFRDSIGKRIKIGALELEVCVEIDPCSRMDEACVGLREALVSDWRGGAGCRVLSPGTIRPGDQVVMA